MPAVNQSGKREKIKLSFFFLVLIIFGLFLLMMPRVSTPLIFGYVIYLIINPAVPALEKLGINRLGSILIVFSSLIFFSTYPFIKIVPTVTSEIENIQYYVPKIEGFVTKKYKELKYEVKDKTSYDIDDKYFYQAVDWVKNTSGSLLLNVPNFLASFLEWVLLIPLIVFFLLKDGLSFKRSFLRLIPNSVFERFYHLSYQFNRKLGDYIFAKFVEASIVGLIITSGLLIMDVRFALLFGIIAAVTNIIPYVGPVLGFVPAALFAFAEYGYGTTSGAIVTLYLIANAIDMALVFPILVSKIVDLHPLTVVVSVILGSQWLGIAGMIVSIPVAAALRLILDEVYKEIYQDT